MARLFRIPTSRKRTRENGHPRKVKINIKGGRTRVSAPHRLFLRYFASVQVEEFLHFFAVIGEGPIFGVMVGVDNGEHYALHVAGIRSGEVCGIEKVEGEGLAIGGSGGLHAWLVACTAVVSEDEAIGTVEVEHGN